MNPTHKRISRLAECVQFDGNNFDAIAPLFESATLHGSSQIILRGVYGGIRTMHVGDWVVTGEDSLVRVYTDDEFTLMYEVLNGLPPTANI